MQAIGREVLKAGFLVLYRSIFDLVRELLSQETQVAESACKQEKGKRATYAALTATATIINERTELRDKLIRAAISLGPI